MAYGAKGVNKKIIEISQTGDDTFEKAILFVNTDNNEIKNEEINRRANQYVSNFGFNRNKIIKQTKTNVFLLLSISGICMLVGLICGILLNMMYG